MKFIKILLPALMLMPLLSWSQCRSFTKNKCLPMLEGYIQNDNFNSAVLIPGDEAELLLTFYGDKEYRLLVCGHPILGEIEFEVMDTDENLIFASKDSPDESNMFDFKVATTQQLIVKVKVPEKESKTALTHQGCVSVMVGSKEDS